MKGSKANFKIIMHILNTIILSLTVHPTDFNNSSVSKSKNAAISLLIVLHNSDFSRNNSLLIAFNCATGSFNT